MGTAECRVILLADYNLPIFWAGLGTKVNSICIFLFVLNYNLGPKSVRKHGIVLVTPLTRLLLISLINILDRFYQLKVTSSVFL